MDPLNEGREDTVPADEADAGSADATGVERAVADTAAAAVAAAIAADASAARDVTDADGSGAAGGSGAADPRIGTLVDGRYKILEAMASGSMGAVYKAERVPVGKLVAIKFLHASFAKDSEFLIRFERETRVMSKLSHPNCVTVVDFGMWEDAPYLVMEYVAGTTLRSLLDHEAIAPQRALMLARQIAAGLAHAHAQGAVHRDVKPANLMITKEVGTGDHVRILDFGLARLRDNAGRDATQLNVVVGTPNYMAPEQTIGGGTIDARTDVYAVGVVLFEMIAGERPYHAEDTHALLGMHRAAPVPKLADRIDRSIVLPLGVQGVIDKAMAKAPGDRYQTALELAEAIDELLGPRVSAEQEVVSPRSHKRARTDPAGVAPTVLDVASGPHTRPALAQFRNRRSLAALAALLVAGVAAGLIIGRLRSSDGGGDGEGGVTPVEDARVALGTGDEIVTPADAEADTAAGDAMAAAVDDAMAAAVDDAGAGPDAFEDDEIEMDPLAAINPDPSADSNTADDEAPDAPETGEDVEHKIPVAPVLARTVREAVQMIQAGKRDLALASLHKLWKNAPKSAYIPFLLGNLYFDRLWWGVALDHYKAAISKHAGYKSNAVLNKNVIKMLGSNKTRRKAQAFLRWTVGRAARPYLRSAAKSHENSTIRRYAASLAKQIR